MPVFGPQFGDVQLQYTRHKYFPEMEHQIHAVKDSGGTIARMHWDEDGVIGNIDVENKHRRKGIATKMWQFAQDLSQQDPTIAQIRHSTTRTPLGDQWAWAIHKKGLSEKPPKLGSPEWYTGEDTE